MTLPSSYVPAIPQATDLLSVSQGGLLLNFESLQAWIDINHLDASSDNAGKHNFVQMPLIFVDAQYPGGPTITATIADEVALFCQPSIINPSVPSLWLAKQSTLLANAIEVSEYTTGSGGDPLHAYLAFKLICGLKVIIGSVTFATTNASNTITFPVPDGIGAFASAPFVVTGQNTENATTPNNNAISLVSDTVSTSTFTMKSNVSVQPNVGTNYIAVGP